MVVFSFSAGFDKSTAAGSGRKEKVMVTVVSVLQLLQQFFVWYF